MRSHERGGIQLGGVMIMKARRRCTRCGRVLKVAIRMNRHEVTEIARGRGMDANQKLAVAFDQHKCVVKEPVAT